VRIVFVPRPGIPRNGGVASVPPTVPRIGIVWAGRPEHARDRQRSIALRSLSSLLDVPRARFVGLQKGPAIVQAEVVPEHVEWLSLGPELDELDDAAAVVAELDLLITVDTALAHLGGIMGKPVWLLVADPPDFRWMIDGEDTPWYPTMRLFRQPAPGDWATPVQRLVVRLRRWVDDWHVARAASPPGPPPAPPAAARTKRDVPKSNAVPGLARALPTRTGFLQYLPDEPLVGRSIEVHGEWLTLVCDAAAALAPVGGVVIESSIGIGAHALSLASKVGAGGHVLAFETRAPMRRIAQHNLTAHRIGHCTILARRLAGPGAENLAGESDTVDDLGLDRLDGIKTGTHDDAEAIVRGAADTLWRCRPWLMLALAAPNEVPAVDALVRSFGYRTWRLDAPLAPAVTFSGRVDAALAGRTIVVLVAMPEERQVHLELPHCTPLA
jgi:hypothetical protein